MDVFVIIMDEADYRTKVTKILKVFKKKGSGLNFTVEVKNHDLSLYINEDQMCFGFGPWSLKPLLYQGYTHSKNVKNGI